MAEQAKAPEGTAVTADDTALVVKSPATQAAAPGTLAHHREFEIHLVKRGEGAYFIRDGHVPFRRNTLVLIPPHVTHRFVPRGGTAVEKITLMFWPARFGRGATFRLGSGTPHVLALDERTAADIEVILRTLQEEIAARQPHWREALALQLRLLFLRIRRAARAHPRAGAAPGAAKPHPAVAWCTTEIERRFAEPLTLEALAREAGYSHYHLAHLFKRATGLGVKQYILQRRIAGARRILVEQPALTVEAVSQQVGFSDFTLFNRVFKRLTGRTPTLYRKISHLHRND